MQFSYCVNWYNIRIFIMFASNLSLQKCHVFDTKYFRDLTCFHICRFSERDRSVYSFYACVWLLYRWCHCPYANVNTVRRRYNAVNFLPEPHNTNPIARPWGWDMGCLLWFWSLIYVLLLSSRRRWSYCDIFDHRVITSFDCTVL